VNDEQHATRFSSDDANARCKFLESKAPYVTWTTELASEGKEQYVIKATYKTVLMFREPEKIDNLWVGHPNGPKTTLPSDQENKDQKLRECEETTRSYAKSQSESLRSECAIVSNRLCKKICRTTVGRRIFDWEAHIITYLEISKTNPSQYASAAISYLCSHLDVVDNKVGRLLQFQALIFVVIATGAATAWNNYHFAVEQRNQHGILILAGLFWVGCFLWTMATALCFWAVRRAAWGDFEQFIQSPSEAQKRYIAFLILEVIKRTAKYRVAVPISFVSLIFLVACLPLLFYFMMSNLSGASARQENSQTSTIQPKPALVSRVGELSDAYFDFNKSAVRQDAQPTLARDARLLGEIYRDFPDAKVVIEGHCDERGVSDRNFGLGYMRATSARQFLGNLGVPWARLGVATYGKEGPICGGHDESCWQQNRRVHFSTIQ
jgi:outer membrane protein OmpA-like peptidoglycan-associated protein